MSIGNSKKEFLFAIYMSLNKEIIEKQLEIGIKEIHLEKWFKKRKVDMNCIGKNGERILIEWQMDFRSYRDHIRQIQDLICLCEKQEKTIIVYGMLDFKEELMSELMQSVVFYSEKNISLVFLKIKKDTLDLLIEINKLDELNRLKELQRLNTVQNIFLDKKSIKISNNSVAVRVVKDDDIYTWEEKLLIKIAKRLREDCSDVSTNVYQYKDVKNCNFIIGSGFQDIIFKVAYDRRKRVLIELCFYGKKKEIFYKLSDKKDVLQNEFNYILKFDDRYAKIGTYYPISWFYSERELMIKRFCRDVKFYLVGFNNHLKHAVERCKNNI
ncbi:hypothetical protein I6U48_26530 [Clostridium sp. PL3]|uniref:Uncharacterized protein n=1 Tax=Clostridium thailandense TaxID=2794346 RepID=A0A949WTP6_9CLOT|nr:hypothetical protein [Clostridium thailandense]MBV7276441.1 hypothetical protein [Clostridium thailandense]